MLAYIRVIGLQVGLLLNFNGVVKDGVRPVSLRKRSMSLCL